MYVRLPQRCRSFVAAGQRAVQSLGRIGLLVVVLASCFGSSVDVHAAPETWFSPAQTVAGNTDSGFGSSLACSAVVPGVSYSYIAVGAPNESSGEGRVHIVGPSGVIQMLAAPSPSQSGNFGYAAAFVKDINGDSINELVVGEPGGNTGLLHAFLSTGDSANPFAFCGSISGAQSFGSSITETAIAVFQGVHLAVGTVDSASLNGVQLTWNHPVCALSTGSGYEGSGTAASRWGQSVAAIETGTGEELVVGAPRDSSNAGRVFSQPSIGASTARFTGTGTDKFGVAVAGRTSSGLFGFSAPGVSGGGSVYVKYVALGGYNNLCTQVVPMADLPDTASRSLVHLEDLFSAFLAVGDGAVAFSSYRSEAQTGGSVGLFGVSLLEPCTGSVKQINNCQYDAGQKQGHALAGGPSCVTSGGTKIMVVGAPGFANGSGRIDTYAEGSEFGSVVPCALPTNTPTATPTAMPTSTPASAATPTAIPVVTNGPIPIDQRTTGLPPPDAFVNKKTVTVVAPELQSNNTKLKFVGYLFTLIQTSSRTSRTTEMKSFGFEALTTKQSKKRELFARRNRTTFRNLGVGAYAANYRPVFTVKQGKVTKRVLGKASAMRVFRVS
jgi:hypothetical protein